MRLEESSKAYLEPTLPKQMSPLSLNTERFTVKCKDVAPDGI